MKGSYRVITNCKIFNESKCKELKIGERKYKLLIANFARN